MGLSELENRSREQLLALYTIGRSINSSLDTVEVLESLLDTTLALFQAEAGSIMMIEGEFLQIAASRGLGEDIVSSTRLRIGESIAGWVAESGQPLLLDGKADAGRFRGLVDREEKITSSLATPLRHRDKLIGVLMIRRGSDETFTQEQVDFLASVADQAALALANAGLYENQRQQLLELDLERQKLEAILASMADGVLVLNPSGDVVKTNSAARDYLGRGQRLGEVLPSLPLERLEASGHLEEEINKDRRCLRLSASPLVVEAHPEGYVVVVHDETERREVERMKSEFLSMVSHELKTPITTIRAFQELMLFREFPPERKRKYLKICLDESERLQTLIEEILALSRLEAGQFAFTKSPVSLEQLVGEALLPFRERSTTHQFSFDSDSIPLLELDPVLMTQAVTNLLSNAVKYSPEGGQVSLVLRRSEDKVVLSVNDQGIGIAPEALSLVFEKFYRVDNSLTRAAGGTGLGLANVKNIVEGHGGSVWAQSQEGEGSTFLIALPMPGRQNQTEAEVSSKKGEASDS